MAHFKKIRHEALHVLLIIAGILSAGLGLKGFLLSSRFIDGGVTGVSLLLANVLHIPLAILIVVINIPFILIAYKQIGAKFMIKSALAILGLALCLAFVKYPHVTPDKLLTAVFGGFFIGAGIGMAIRGGAVLDGTEIAALLISKSTPTLRVGDVILIFNILIFSAAAFFLGIESALYSMLAYFAASKTVDFLLHGIEEYTSIIVISEKSDEIRHAILSVLRRGVTIIKAQRGLSDKEQNIVYCVVTRLEIGRVKNLVHELDDSAFVLVHPLADAEGGVIRRHANT